MRAHSSRYRRASRFVACRIHRQQTKPFIVEIKPCPEAQANPPETATWAKLDLPADPNTLTATAVGETSDRF